MVLPSYIGYRAYNMNFNNVMYISIFPVSYFKTFFDTYYCIIIWFLNVCVYLPARNKFLECVKMIAKFQVVVYFLTIYLKKTIDLPIFACCQIWNEKDEMWTHVPPSRNKIAPPPPPQKNNDFYYHSKTDVRVSTKRYDIDVKVTLLDGCLYSNYDF